MGPDPPGSITGTPLGALCLWAPPAAIAAPHKFLATTAPPWVPSVPVSPQPRAQLEGHRWQPCTQACVPKQAWRRRPRAGGTLWGHGGPVVAGAAACTQTKGSPCPAAGSVPAATSPTAPVQVTGLARDRGTSTGSEGGGGTARTLSLTAEAKQMAPELAPACGEAGPSRAYAGATSSCGARRGREPPGMKAPGASQWGSSSLGHFHLHFSGVVGWAAPWPRGPAGLRGCPRPRGCPGVSERGRPCP